MSSYVDTTVDVAPAVAGVAVATAAPIVAAGALVVGAAMGAGWLLWKSGELTVNAYQEIERRIAENIRQKEEAEKHRRMVAVSTHNQLVNMCKQIMTKVDADAATIGDKGSKETTELKKKLNEIINTNMPEDIMQYESAVSVGYLKLEEVISRQKKLEKIMITEADKGAVHGLAVADLMDNLKVTIGTMEVSETRGTDVRAADPRVIERIKLNEELSEVMGQIKVSIDTIKAFAEKFRFSKSAEKWFLSCFNGVDLQIEELCNPSTSNKDVKKGIKRLKEELDSYKLMAPMMYNESEKMSTLYSVYKEAASALGETVLNFDSFASAKDIEAKLKDLNKRSVRAAECRKIFEKCGSKEAYVCYACEQELLALGYEVHSKEHVMEMAGREPEEAEVNGVKIPFYKWGESDLTSLYSIGDQCSLQVIVHPNGSVSMEAIAEGSDKGKIVDIQKNHCKIIKLLHDRLRDRWFIINKYEEKADAEKVTTLNQWRGIKAEDMQDQESTNDSKAVKYKYLK